MEAKRATIGFIAAGRRGKARILKFPEIIQGGMGTGVSNWLLARAVSVAGQLGVVSGTAIDTIFARRLQDGDAGGHMRRAMAHFPVPDIAKRVVDRYFVEGGKPQHKAYKPTPMFTLNPNRIYQELVVCANYAEVWLAKEGHKGRVGVNLLEKIQVPNIYSLYGAMLAGVDYVLMGAGIPRDIPGALDRLSKHLQTKLRINVAGAKTPHDTTMEPTELLGQELPELKRPDFLAIVSSGVLAKSLQKKATGEINGFIFEGPKAGGHNAPPRGKLQLNDRGEPIYGEKDSLIFDEFNELGKPYWVAGAAADPNLLRYVQSKGAKGVQVGTLFAFSDESGMLPSIKRYFHQRALEDNVDVYTDPKASPTGFPFKVAKMEGSISEEDAYQARQRVCDLGYLRSAYEKEDGSLGYRCPSEPVEIYERKGGKVEDTVGRKCLCNGLLANIGQPQRRKDGSEENVLVTAGDEINRVVKLLRPDREGYSATDVIRYLLSEPAEARTPEPKLATATASL